MNFFIEMRSGYFSFDDIKWNYVVKFRFLVRGMRVCVCVLCFKDFFFFFSLWGGGRSASLICCGGLFLFGRNEKWIFNF